MIDSIPQLILGSGSPRRSELLRRLGLRFIVDPADVDESYPEDSDPYSIAAMLAERKAATVSRRHPDRLVLTADTIVILDEAILGKPRDLTDARRTLSRLSDRIHSVSTAYCLQQGDKTHTRTIQTEVQIAPLSEEEIEYYLSRYEVLDKAGSYGIQDWIGYSHILSIDGSYLNIVGLPTAQLYADLKDWKDL